MFEIELHDRRIAVARIVSCETLDEARALADGLRAIFSRVPDLAVATADLRAAQLFSPEVTEALVGLLRADNPKVERSGHLIGRSSAVLALQVERLVREAGNPRRKVFRALPEMEQYLGEILTPPQRGWLHEWYVAGTPRAAG